MSRRRWCPLAVLVALASIVGGTLAPPAARAARANKVWDIPGSGFQPGDPVVALTFDDGPDPRWTPRILSVLETYGVGATFFAVGRAAAAHPDLVRAEVAAGNGVGNHTWDHADLTRARDLRHQIDDTSRLLAGLSGRPVTCARPPYGRLNSAVVAQLDRRELATVMWAVDPHDYHRPGADAIASRVLATARAGSVVIMHDGGGDRSQTVAALPRIIEGLLARGLRPVPVCAAGADAAPAAAAAPPAEPAVEPPSVPAPAPADSSVVAFGEIGFIRVDDLMIRGALDTSR